MVLEIGHFLKPWILRQRRRSLDDLSVQCLRTYVEERANAYANDHLNYVQRLLRIGLVGDILGDWRESVCLGVSSQHVLAGQARGKIGRVRCQHRHRHHEASGLCHAELTGECSDLETDVALRGQQGLLEDAYIMKGMTVSMS